MQNQFFCIFFSFIIIFCIDALAYEEKLPQSTEMFEPLISHDEFELNAQNVNNIYDNSSYELRRWQILDKNDFFDSAQKKFIYSPQDLKNKEDDFVFRMQEFDTNYITMGKPDTKIQFSFKFKFFKNAPVYLGYTQIMFWDLFRKESNPFSDINFNPEFFYKFKDLNSLINEVDIGFSHLSNGKDEAESRSVDSLYLRLTTKVESKYGIPKLQIIFRYLFNEDKTNKDINEYYGPVALRLYFDRLGQKIFQSEQFYFEYYNGGLVIKDYSRGSVRLSARFKLLASEAAPKFYIQYFNGYGENLVNYNLREETFRVGFSIGGF